MRSYRPGWTGKDGGHAGACLVQVRPNSSGGNLRPRFRPPPPHEPRHFAAAASGLLWSGSMGLHEAVGRRRARLSRGHALLPRVGAGSRPRQGRLRFRAGQGGEESPPNRCWGLPTAPCRPVPAAAAWRSHRCCSRPQRAVRRGLQERHGHGLPPDRQEPGRVCGGSSGWGRGTE